MSEFKFACPICGQHITADSATTGAQIECPTCFRSIIVPQAPSSPDSKFILSAAQVSGPRPVSEVPGDFLPVPAAKHSPWTAVILFFFLGAAAAAAFIFRDRIFTHSRSLEQKAAENTAKDARHAAAPEAHHDLPTGFSWTLNLTNAPIPEADVAGGIHGFGFVSERAILQPVNSREPNTPPRCSLSFRQGKTDAPDLGVSVHFFASVGEELAGKSIEIDPDRAPPVPKVFLRWKDSQQKPVTRSFFSGYALKVEFGQPANGIMPGKLYLCLPDEQKSFVAGAFEAEIRKPAPPKPRAPKPTTPAPPASGT